MRSFIKANGAWLIPLLAMAIFTPFSPAIDLAVSKYFYDPVKGFSDSKFYSFMYTYGLIPAQLTFMTAAVLLFLSSFFSRWKKWQPASLVLVLTLAIGAGLIAHVMLKDHWGRPRPRQVVEFGGNQQFRPYYSPNFSDQPEPSKSFSCGHCTMGFYFFSLALVARRIGSRSLYIAGIILAIVLGGALSLTRIAQGGHFLSDTLASALIMWLTAYFCDKLVFSSEGKS